MKAGINTACINRILLYFGKPHIVTNYNKERTVWYLTEFKGTYNWVGWWDYKFNEKEDIELPLCEIEKLDVIFNFDKIIGPVHLLGNNGGWIEDYDLLIPVSGDFPKWSTESGSSDTDPMKFKRVKSYYEIFGKVKHYVA